MRILYVAAGTPIPGTHGGSVHALEICRALANRGHEVHVAALAGGSETERQAALAGLAFHPLVPPLRPKIFEWTAAPQVERIARAVRPDVIIERFYTFGGTGLRAGDRLGIPAVLEVNSPARSYPGSWRDRLDALTVIRPVDRRRRTQLRRAAGFYATSRHLLPPELQDRVRVVVNGVDPERFAPAERRSEGGPLRLAFVSSFNTWHGAEDLVRAVAECTARGVDVTATCIGRGPRWSAARDAAARAGLGERMSFLGEVPHDAVPEHLRQAHVGVAPFHPAAHRALELGWFWSPIKLFEYLACGLAVVTADVAELRELLPNDVARFYRAGDTSALANVLTALARERDQRARMGAAARVLAVSRYSWDRQAAVVEEVLEEALARRAPSAR